MRGVLHPADILHNAAGRHVRRLDNRRQTIRFRELDEIVLIHLGDDLRYFLMIRERGDDEVRLVRLRERDERVRLRQALLAQDVRLRTVGADDGCLRQERFHDAAAGRVALDDRRVDVHARQLQRQPLGNTAATDDDDALGLVAKLTDLAKQFVQLVRCTDHGDIVSGGEHKVAVRDRDAALTLHGTDEDAIAVAAAEIVQTQAVELAALAQLELHELHEAIGKRLDLRSGREAQRTRDLLGRCALGVDGQTQPQLILQQHHVLIILLVAHARDRMRGTELAPDHAADEVRLVRSRRGDKQVGVRDVGDAQLVHIRAALDHDHIQRGGNIGSALRITLDDGNVMPFCQKLFRNGITHAASAHDHNFHILSSPVIMFRPLVRVTKYYSRHSPMFQQQTQGNYIVFVCE